MSTTKKNHRRATLAGLVVGTCMLAGGLAAHAPAANAATWRGTWYGPIYSYNRAETQSIANSAYNIPTSDNPFAWIVPTYRFWWSQTAKTASSSAGASAST